MRDRQATTRSSGTASTWYQWRVFCVRWEQEEEEDEEKKKKEDPDKEKPEEDPDAPAPPQEE